jgi:hypothetical protein
VLPGSRAFELTDRVVGVGVGVGVRDAGPGRGRVDGEVGQLGSRRTSTIGLGQGQTQARLSSPNRVGRPRGFKNAAAPLVAATWG